MIEKGNVVAEALRRALQLPIGHYLEVCSYKRDRGFLLVRSADDAWLVVEQGFEQARLEAAGGGLERVLRKVVKREFPRSNKLRLYAMGEYRSGAAEGLRSKVL